MWLCASIYTQWGLLTICSIPTMLWWRATQKTQNSFTWSPRQVFHTVYIGSVYSLALPLTCMVLSAKTVSVQGLVLSVSFLAPIVTKHYL